jgi:hypothetical protein
MRTVVGVKRRSANDSLHRIEESPRHASTNHPFAHEAHDVVFDRRRRGAVEAGRPNQ